jgi:conjugative transfer signal peptidase TraF
MTPPHSAISSGAARRAPSSRGRGRLVTFLHRSWRGKAFLTAVCLAALVTASAALTASHLTRNYTPSLPLGVYWLRPGLPPIQGEIVDFAIPSAATSLIVGRYLPVGFHLLKRVVAVRGDRVCLSDRQYSVNDVTISTIASVDSLGRTLPVFSFCGDVPLGMAFVATSVPSSLDSRYFGPVPASALTVARPLWSF